MKEKQELFYDVIILGAGPAGFSAAVYAARGNLKTAILDINMFGGQPSNYLELENYPGFSLISGFELMEKFEEHSDKFGAEKFPMAEIQKINLIPEIKIIETNDTIFKAKTVIIATGAQAKKLGIPGENEFKGRGVSYCAVCDGAFYKDKTTVVVGGGNSAIEEAVYLTKFAKKVYVIHRRDELRADKIIQERAFNNEKIEFILNSVPLEIRGSNTVEQILLENLKTNEKFELNTDGVFPYIGFSPNVDSLNGQVKQNSQGFIETDVNMQTSIKGVYAAGDVRNTPLRQVITAAADGAIAACSAVKYIETFTPVHA
ncbi:MAG: thioredoxin-disulfide reductase [Candidatus Gastranaerophilales bacterium]|nr:thioredoxin-disulfide reductase [Candidatus Gastranaerophilales bacterium]